ncbi:MAG: co-chaperone GroES [Nitrospirota bacterium]
MAIKPLQDWVVIEQDQAKETMSSGIIIPEAAKEAPYQGKVISVGEGKFVSVEPSKGRGRKKAKNEEKTFVKTTLKPGDYILYEQYAAREIDIDGNRWVLVREEDVLGLLA